MRMMTMAATMPMIAEGLQPELDEAAGAGGGTMPWGIDLESRVVFLLRSA